VEKKCIQNRVSKEPADSCYWPKEIISWTVGCRFFKHFEKSFLFSKNTSATLV